MQKTHKTLWTILIVIVLVSMILISVLPYVNAQEVPHDLSVNSRGISFSQSNFFAGDTIRIYGTVENVGTKDMTGYVQFFKGITPIQNEIPLSSKASGAPEEVWVDWIAEEGTYNIQFRILDSTPTDQNTSNNQTVSPLLTISARPVPPPTPPPASTTTAPPPTTASTPPTSTASTPPPKSPVVQKKEPVAAPLQYTNPGDTLPTYAQEEEGATMLPLENPDPSSLPTSNSSLPVTDLVPETTSDTANNSIPQASMNPASYFFLLCASLVLMLLLLILAYVFLRKAKKTRQTLETDPKNKRSVDQSIKDFLTSENEDKT